MPPTETGRPRQWTEQLQELRVTQTGVQLIAGFLLTLPFQERFEMLDDFGRAVYLVLVMLATTAVALTLVPVALHRSEPGHDESRAVTRTTRLITWAVLWDVGLLMTGIVLFVCDMVLHRGWAMGIAAVVLAGMTLLLTVVPRGVAA